MQQSKTRFELGLVMAGAISGGAYTAGVMDFLIQALDAWEQEKATNSHGLEHDVMLRIMSGASAGGMSAAISAFALNCDITHVTEPDNPPSPQENRLYDAWVRQIDISKLLRTRDIENDGRVTSLLDSSELETISYSALTGRRRAQPRRYVEDPLAVILTVTNLRGVPYGFELFGRDKGALYGMSSHMDEIRFAVSSTGKTIAAARSLNPTDAPEGEWPALAQAALATGAFPVGLRPRALQRPHSDYDKWFKRPPHWGEPPPSDPYGFLCVDGGLMNNEPLELARRYLSGGKKKNPREGTKAHRAVIMVDPFPNLLKFDKDWSPDDRIHKVVGSIFSSLISQARFKPEELELAEKEDVYSRFIISPSRQDEKGNPVEPAMTAAILGGFGGFLSEAFRRHDYQLGRRNCQAFLRWHFCLPETNPLFAGTKAADRKRYHIQSTSGQKRQFGSKDGPGVPLLPIIPLVGGLEKPVPLPPRPQSDAVDLPTLEKAIRKRAKAVGNTFISSDLKPIMGGPMRWIARRYWQWRVAPRVSTIAVKKIQSELERL